MNSGTIALATLALSLSACINAPTPLDPGLAGAIGSPSRGVQTAAAELPVQGDGFVRYRPHSSHYFGRPRLIRAIEDAAAEVRRRAPFGAPLVVGDLSAETGGHIPGHASHRTGRDVDLLLLVETPEGVPIRSPGFVHFEGDGLAFVPETKKYIRLDVDREWLLLRSLLTSPEIGVQFMFIYRDVEALLIDHARALGEPDALVWHAETVMLQPRDSLAHDDHVHLRIACTSEEAVGGCKGGPHWDWLPAAPPPYHLTAGDLTQISREDPFALAPFPRDRAANASRPGGA